MAPLRSRTVTELFANSLKPGDGGKRVVSVEGTKTGCLLLPTEKTEEPPHRNAARYAWALLLARI